MSPTSETMAGRSAVQRPGVEDDTSRLTLTARAAVLDAWARQSRQTRIRDWSMFGAVVGSFVLGFVIVDGLDALLWLGLVFVVVIAFLVVGGIPLLALIRVVIVAWTRLRPRGADLIEWCRQRADGTHSDWPMRPLSPRDMHALTHLAAARFVARDIRRGATVALMDARFVQWGPPDGFGTDGFVTADEYDAWRTEQLDHLRRTAESRVAMHKLPTDALNAVRPLRGKAALREPAAVRVARERAFEATLDAIANAESGRLSLDIAESGQLAVQTAEPPDTHGA